jgi:drug/metabolite transporter superfamily protein YnfA
VGIRDREKSRTIMVIGGILLFVFGFLVTLAAVQDNHASAASDGITVEESVGASDISRNVFLMSGILISLAGVVLATVGPVAGMFKVKQ